MEQQSQRPRANLKPGTYRIIRTDGTEETVARRCTLAIICQTIKCEMFETVALERGESPIIMAVYDIGMVAGKAVNEKATALYHTVCRPGTITKIHGDVVICWDNDFAE